MNIRERYHAELTVHIGARKKPRSIDFSRSKTVPLRWKSPRPTAKYTPLYSTHLPFQFLLPLRNEIKEK